MRNQSSPGREQRKTHGHQAAWHVYITANGSALLMSIVNLGGTQGTDSKGQEVRVGRE